MIVLLANSPHPLDDRPEYTGSVVRLHGLARASDRDPTSTFRTTTPERQRAFENTDDYLRSDGYW